MTALKPLILTRLSEGYSIRRIWLELRNQGQVTVALCNFYRQVQRLQQEPDAVHLPLPSLLEPRATVAPQTAPASMRPADTTISQFHHDPVSEPLTYTSHGSCPYCIWQGGSEGVEICGYGTSTALSAVYRSEGKYENRNTETGEVVGHSYAWVGTLSAGDLKDIERNFADALGYTDHQRVVGTHVNTDNFHMHVAYSKIHPVTLKCVTPKKDFFALEGVCRAMEKKYGLFADKGPSDTKERDKAAQKARRFERQTWQQSFEGHLQEHKTEILAAVGGAKTWRQVQEGLAGFDAGLKKRGAGLVFYHLGETRRTMKASSLDRSCSLAALEERFGPFEPAKDIAKGEERRRHVPKRPYTAKPLFHHPGQDQLWRLYQTGKRKAGFLSRNVHLRNWKSYLLADAHKDALALATILFYKELLRTLEGAPAPVQAPKAIQPALQAWFSSLPWFAPGNALKQPDYLPGVGLKADGAGRVLFPMRDDKGRIWAVRAVDRQGRTCDIGDMAMQPKLKHVIDPKKLLANAEEPYRGPVLLTVNCSAAVKLHKYTGAPVMIVAREKDLPELAKGLRNNYAKATIIVAAPEQVWSAKRAAAVAAVRFLTVKKLLALSGDLADQVRRGNIDKERPSALVRSRIAAGTGDNRPTTGLFPIKE